jgi:hypothetical protein
MRACPSVVLVTYPVVTVDPLVSSLVVLDTSSPNSTSTLDLSECFLFLSFAHRSSESVAGRLVLLEELSCHVFASPGISL